MCFERKSPFLPALILFTGILALAASCTVVKEYDVKADNIDLTATVMEDGVTIPLGQTEKLSLGNLINAAGESINDYIQTDADGNLALKYDGNVSLSEKLAELNLGEMATMDQFSFNTPFEFHLGDLNVDGFTIAGFTEEVGFDFEGIKGLDIETGAGASTEAFNFHAGLDKFKDALSGDDFNLSAKIGNISQDFNVIDHDALAPGIAQAVTDEVSIPKDMLQDTVLPDTEVEVTMTGIDLQKDVLSVSNLKTNPNAKLVVEAQLTNVFLTDGTIVPDVEIDFSKIFIIKGGSKVNVKQLVLNKDNNWSRSATFDVEGLVKTDYVGSISLSEKVVVSGTVEINDPVTTKTSFNGTNGDVKLNFKIYFTDLTIDSADIAIAPVEFNENDNVSLGDFNDVTLPAEIQEVKAIYLDETKPMTLTVTPSNVNRLKSKNIPCDITLSFPATMEVEGTVAGKLVLAGDLANGPVSKDIVIKSIKPTVSGGKLSIDSKVGVSASVRAQNMVINSTQIPATEADDLAFAVTVSGSPVVKDYVVKLNNYNQQVDFGGDLEFDASDLGDFGSFRITPEGSPALTIGFNLPELEGLTIAPSAEGLKLCLPDVFEFDASAIDGALAFNKNDNSITIKNNFPNSVSLPVKELVVKPKDGKIVSQYSAKGGVVITGDDVHESDLEASLGAKGGLTINVPEIKPASITLDDKLSFDINQKLEVTISNLPDAIKKVDEIILDEVYLNMEATFDGLPSSDASPFTVDLVATLPEFISPNVVPIKGTVKGGALKITPVKIEKLYGVDLTNSSELKGSISISGSISSDGGSIDLSALKPDIKADLAVTLGDKNQKITISKATGVFSYDVKEETTMKLDNLPAMLRDDKVCLDLADPRIYLDITSNIGIPMGATLELVPYRNGSVMQSSTITLQDVKLPYSTDASKNDTKSYCICKAASSAPVGREALIADVSKLLKQMPDSLQVKIDASVDPSRTSVLEPSAKYVLDITYGINVPLSFGSDFAFATETELDLQSAATVFSFGDFGIKGKVLNDSPLNLNVEIELLDSNGGVIPQSKSSSINIAGATTSDVEFYLSPSDKSKTLSKARLKVKVTALPDVPVKSTDCIQFTNLVATAPDGLTIDPTSLK